MLRSTHKAALFTLGITCGLLLLTTAECRWKFPGMEKRDKADDEEEEAFEKTMNDLLQPGADCNVLENENALKEVNNFLKSAPTISTIQEHFKKHGNGKLCRYDLAVCDPESKKCECSGNAAFDQKSGTCRIRIGWPCTEGEADKPNQCVPHGACKPWEGSFSYDTETFPTVSDFFTDPGKFFCRCNDEDDPDCGGAGDAVGRMGRGVGARAGASIILAVVCLTSNTIIMFSNGKLA